MNKSRNKLKRDCRKRITVPSRDDHIQVLWILDNVSSTERAEWCVADVLYVESIHEGEVLARGYIRYPAINGLYEEQLDQVEFLPNSLLRCSRSACNDASGGEGSDQNEETSDAPKMSWRFSLDGRNGDENESDDDSWEGDITVAQQWKRRGQETKHEEFRDIRQDMLQLRKRYTYVQIELERVKRQMVDVSSKVALFESPRSEFLDRELHRIFSRLRSRIVLKFQSPVRSISHMKGRSSDGQSSDAPAAGARTGVQRGCWRVRVECDLDQFELFARAVQTDVEMESRVRFFPEYSHTQCPPRSSTEFHIVVPTFFDICAILDIGSFSDRLEMMRKCCATQQSTVVRLVGSYVYDDRSSAGPCYINVGSSGVFCAECCNNVISSDSGQSTESEENIGCDIVATDGFCAQRMKDTIPILARNSRAWDLTDARFLSPLKVRRGKACLGSDPRDCSDTESGNQLFQIIWRRAAELSSRLWSTELSKNCAVHGVLEVVIPYVHIHGEMLCAEFASVATEDVLASVISNYSK